MAARAGLAAVAVLLLAWLGVLERDTRLQIQAVNSARAGRVVTAVADLRQARTLNPDPMPELLRSLLYVAHGNRQRAAAGIEHVLRREPENLLAWTDLLVVAGGHNLTTARRARVAIAHLDPRSSGG